MRHARLGTVAAALLIALAGCDSARTLEPGGDLGPCERCHGFPPAAPHPTVASDPVACSACHSDTVDASGNIIAGGAHQNGAVDVTVAHAIPFLAEHPAAALAGIASCKGCHGNDYTGGSSGVSCTGCHTTTPGIADWTANCTFCHGTRTAGVTTATAQAAPPQSVVVTGDQTRTNPKVGAHQAHLNAGTYAAALACDSCHAVPNGAAALTHFVGDGSQATITFSTTASQGVTGAAYAGAGGSCNVYCHGSGTELSGGQNKTPAWTSTGLACDACHGLPPASGPTFLAPNAHEFHVSTVGIGCSSCHAGYTSSSVDTGTHVNGAKEAIVGTTRIDGWDCSTCHGLVGVPAATHPVPYDNHTTDALAGITSCTSCHGASYGDTSIAGATSCNQCHGTFGYADWKTNCTFCHGTRTQGFTGAPVWLPAPPQAVVAGGDQTSSNPKIGAHQKHAGNGSTLSNGVACTECHPAATDLAHIGGSGTAQLVWGPLATNGGATASMTGATCSNYCHGATLPGTRPAPTWAPPSAMTCGSCHNANPTSGRHPAAFPSHVIGGTPMPCSFCHSAGFDVGVVDKAAHIDGAIRKDPSLNFQGPPEFTVKSCDPSCHGRENW